MSHVRDEDPILSLFVDSPSVWDKLHRGVKDYTYVVEYRWNVDAGYGGLKQKQHQRRYGDMIQAMRRFDYLLVKHDVEKAFILQMPIDTATYKRQAVQEHARCTRCGGHDIKWDEKEHKAFSEQEVEE